MSLTMVPYLKLPFNGLAGIVAKSPELPLLWANFSQVRKAGRSPFTTFMPVAVGHRAHGSKGGTRTCGNRR